MLLPIRVMCDLLKTMAKISKDVHTQSTYCSLSIYRMEFSIENRIDRQWIFRAKFCGLSKLTFDIHFVKREREREKELEWKANWKRVRRIIFQIKHQFTCLKMSWICLESLHSLCPSRLMLWHTSIKWLKRLFRNNSIFDQMHGKLSATYTHIQQMSALVKLYLTSCTSWVFKQSKCKYFNFV